MYVKHVCILITSTVYALAVTVNLIHHFLQFSHVRRLTGTRCFPPKPTITQAAIPTTNILLPMPILLLLHPIMMMIILSCLWKKNSLNSYKIIAIKYCRNPLIPILPKHACSWKWPGKCNNKRTNVKSNNQKRVPIGVCRVMEREMCSVDSVKEPKSWLYREWRNHKPATCVKHKALKSVRPVEVLDGLPIGRN